MTEREAMTDRGTAGPPDEDLVARVALGDRTAYAMLVDRHINRFLGHATRVMGSRAQAEDVLQDCFTKLWTHADRFDARTAKFTTWFYRVVQNRCLDEKRRKKPVALPENYDAVDDRAGADEDLERAQVVARVKRAVDALPDRQKIALTLTYFEGQKNAEAALIMGVGVKALESLLVRARRALNKELLSEKATLLGS